MTVRGVGVSTKLAGFFFGFEMLVLIIVSIAELIKNGGHLSLVPFEPSHILNGAKGLAAGFPLAVYLVISYVIFSYATVTGFGYNAAKLGAAPIPFISVAQGILASFAFFAYLAGL